MSRILKLATLLVVFTVSLGAQRYPVVHTNGRQTINSYRVDIMATSAAHGVYSSLPGV